MRTWWHAVVESRHELLNPTSPEKIRELGERLGLGPESDVLDLASGIGGPALLLAETFGCRLTCVERAPEFVATARRRTADAGLEDRIEIVESDAASFELGRHDAVLCIGATFVYGGLVPTLERLRPPRRSSRSASRTGVCGRCRRPPGEDDPRAPPRTSSCRSLETVERFESTGVRVVSLIASSEDDWDRYESLHWETFDDWLAANPDHPQADEFRARGAADRARYLAWERDVMGWAIFVCRT